MTLLLQHAPACDCSRCRTERKNRGTHKFAVAVAKNGGWAVPSRPGGPPPRGVFVAKWVPYCDNPVHIWRMITSREAVDDLKALEVSAKVPCRRCEKCLQFRQMKWRERAISELALAKRTWFVTLTFSPMHLAGVLMEAKGTEHKHIEAAAYPHIQRYLKRLRKLNEFRYLAIYERGAENGRSHYHMFLHETGSRPITKSTIDAQWRSFVHARLISSDKSSGSASYLTKYATKHFDIRPRASVGYGKLQCPENDNFQGEKRPPGTHTHTLTTPTPLKS